MLEAVLPGTLYNSKGIKVEEYKVKYKFEGFEFQVNEVVDSIRKNKLESQLVPLDESLETLSVMDQLLHIQQEKH